MTDKDYRVILDQYWEVIEACIEMQKDYAGTSEKYTKGHRICPDSVGDVIEKLIQARKRFPIKRVTQWQQQ
jgi:hypothetical protein